MSLIPTADQFSFKDEVLDSPIPVVVDFWAPWCAPCRAVAPVLEELAKEFVGKVKVVKVNTDDEPELAQVYGIRSIPTIHVFKEGSLVKSLVGAKPKATLSAEFEALAD